MLQSFKEYLLYEKKCSPNTLQSYMTDLTQFENFYRARCNGSEGKATQTAMVCAGGFDEVSIHLAQQQDVRAWISALTESKMNSRSVNRKIASLKAFFRFAESKGVVKESPMSKIKALKTSRPLPLFVREAAMYKLLEEMEFGDDLEGQRDRLIIELLYGTGVRLSELIHLRKSDINFEDATLKVNGKKDIRRLIPIHDILLDFLRKYVEINPGEYLITTPKGEQAYPMLIYRAVKRLLSQANLLEHKHPQALRHTFTTHLLSKGADLTVIDELLDNGSSGSARLNAHNSLEKLRRVFEQAHPKA